MYFAGTEIDSSREGDWHIVAQSYSPVSDRILVSDRSRGAKSAAAIGASSSASAGNVTRT
jgi:hypothetical protein